MTVAEGEEETALQAAAVTQEPVATQARRALWWSVANQVVGRVGTTLMGIVLARILVPEDYGVYAVALVALNGLLSMNELGVSVAIVRWPSNVARIAPTVKTLAMSSSVVLYIAMFFAAPQVAQLLNAPEATGVLRVLTLSVLIDALTAVPAALMTREFMQKERLIVDSAGFVVGFSSAIGLALAGYGPWALVWSVLLGNIVNALFILKYAPVRYRWGFKRDVARELLAFGVPLAIASLFVMALLNIDYVVIGADLGPKDLGFYLLAFNLCMWPVNMFSAPARRVSLPLFAKLHAGKTDPSDAFVPVCALLLLVTLPACLVLAVFAEPLVRLVYGDTWAPSATVLPWLMLLALARVMGELVYDFLVALGHSRPNLVIQVVWLVALVIALPIGVRTGGIEGVAIGHAVVAVLIVAPMYAFFLRRAGVSLRLMATQLSRPFAGTLVAAVASVAVVVLVSGGIAQLLLGGALVGLLYLAIVYPMRAMLKASVVGSA
jgi:O-antigen/teichoic acid export membrane protein